MEPQMPESFGLIKKRNLFQTHSFKMACRAFDPRKCRKRIIMAPPMTKASKLQYESPPPVRLSISRGPVTQETDFRSLQEERSEKYTEFLSKRRDLRMALDGLGHLDSWFHNKPNLTEMESRVMERSKQTQQNTPSDEVLSKVQERIQPKKDLCQNVQLPSIGGIKDSTMDHFRTKCMEDYQGSLMQCQRHGIPVSQLTLKRVLLYPEDVSAASVLKGHGKGRRNWMSYSILPQKQIEDDDNIDPKEISRRADSNAFWPGHDDHVRLYLPVISNRHESVLFSRVEHTPAPCHGHWPVNQAGYYTSGDINRHKVYIL